VVKGFVFKVIKTLGDVGKGLTVTVPHEGTQTGNENVGNDTKSPHVTGWANRLIVDYFWRDEFWCSEKNSERSCTVVLLGKPKINDFDIVGRSGETQYVFGLKKNRKMLIKLTSIKVGRIH